MRSSQKFTCNDLTAVAKQARSRGNTTFPSSSDRLQTKIKAKPARGPEYAAGFVSFFDAREPGGAYPFCAFYYNAGTLVVPVLRGVVWAAVPCAHAVPMLKRCFPSGVG
eukprot:4026137-Amphidinium_carterae.1